MACGTHQYTWNASSSVLDYQCRGGCRRYVGEGGCAEVEFSGFAAGAVCSLIFVAMTAMNNAAGSQPIIDFTDTVYLAT